MERYKEIKTIGDGTYGSVAKAVHRNTGQVVAIKKMKRKVRSWDECINLREIKALRRISHPNIVNLLEIIKSNNLLSLVFEFLDEDVYHHIKDRKKLLSEPQVRNILFQTLQGLGYMHSLGIFHRDLKPENLLYRDNIVKIADFGLAKEFSARPPFTDYVSTRWYRAPEVLLRSARYDGAIDIFAVGAIMAELFTFKPLFPGANEVDQLFKVSRVMGAPKNWPDGVRLAQQLGWKFPQDVGIPLQNIVQFASEPALDLMNKMLQWDPKLRPTAYECLQHPFFGTTMPIPRNPEASVKKPQPPQTNRPPDVYSKKRKEEKTLPRKSVLDRMKQARYQPGYVCS